MNLYGCKIQLTIGIESFSTLHIAFWQAFSLEIIKQHIPSACSDTGNFKQTLIVLRTISWMSEVTPLVRTSVISFNNIYKQKNSSTCVFSLIVFITINSQFNIYGRKISLLQSVTFKTNIMSDFHFSK